MVLPYDEGVFYGLTKVSEVNVVSKVQLYVDLLTIRLEVKKLPMPCSNALRKSGVLE